MDTDAVQFEVVNQFRMPPHRVWNDDGVVVFDDEEKACQYANSVAGSLEEWQRVVVYRVTRELVHTCNG